MKQIKNLEMRKERYLRDGIPIRLGGLAANLARVRSFSENVENSDVVFQLLEESKYFIEWIGRELDIDSAVRLCAMQRQMAVWQLNWASVWNDSNSRKRVATDSARWSTEIIMNSGLLDQ